MAAQNDTASMALFCDFENIALGVRDAQYDKFDIRPVLERLLAKGSIVVKKAYCDWDRYKTFKAAMHEANFELIEIPHVRQSGKNSADIRMVVDALDLCYTKAHVDTFVIISGDSDFSPLVSKLRENAKKVIGVGVKQSCSDLLVTNCDEFIYYDDLVRDRESERTVQRREREKRSPEDEAKRREKQEERKCKAIDIVSATFVDLIADRGDGERIWASVLKEVVKRRNPGFNENYYGFRSFGYLLEEAANRGLLGFGRDEKGAYVFRAALRQGMTDNEMLQLEAAPDVVSNNEPLAVDAVKPPEMPAPETAPEPGAKGNGRRRNTRGRRRTGDDTAGKTGQSPELVVAPEPETPALVEEEKPLVTAQPELVVEAPLEEVPTPIGVELSSATLEAAETSATPEVAPVTKPRRGRRPGKKATAAAAEPVEVPLVNVEVVVPEPVAAVAVAPVSAPDEGGEAPAAKRKPARRTTRSRKPKADETV